MQKKLSRVLSLLCCAVEKHYYHKATLIRLNYHKSQLSCKHLHSGTTSQPTAPPQTPTEPLSTAFPQTTTTQPQMTTPTPTTTPPLSTTTGKIQTYIFQLVYFCVW